MSLQVVLDKFLDTQLVDAPQEAPLAPDQVRVQVSHAGVNFWEVMQRRGQVPLAAPRVLGTEGTGTVEAVGVAVTNLTVGQRVAWSRVPGSFAERITAPAIALVPVPDSVSAEAAAAVLFQGQTAHYLSHEAWRLDRGDIAVVTAAAGGVGQLLVQLLTAQGVRTIGVVSSEEKVKAARSAGADEVLLYGADLASDVRGLAPQGVSAVFDAVGAGIAEPLVATLRPRGAMVLYGSASGQEADITAKDLVAGSLYLTRTAGRDYLGAVDRVREISEQLMDMVAVGAIQPAVGAIHPLCDAGRALDELLSRQSVGKILLQP